MPQSCSRIFFNRAATWWFSHLAEVSRYVVPSVRSVARPLRISGFLTLTNSGSVCTRWHSTFAIEAWAGSGGAANPSETARSVISRVCGHQPQDTQRSLVIGHTGQFLRCLARGRDPELEQSFSGPRVLAKRSVHGSVGGVSAAGRCMGSPVRPRDHYAG